jgi:cytochrome c oxidase subunit 4
MTEEHSLKRYFAVFAALIALTAMTTFVDYVDLGRMNFVVAMAIAAAKAMLVALFFMNLRHSAGLFRVVAITGLLFLAILMAGSLADGLTREWSPTPSDWGPAITLPQP